MIAHQKQHWISLGVRPNHRIIGQYPNSVDYVVKLLAAWECDAVYVPIHPHIAIRKQHLEIIRPFMIESSASPVSFMENAIDQNPISIHDGLALILFTSGSSGIPKAVPLTHTNIISGLESISKIYPEDRINYHDRSFAFLPWCHIYGLVCELLFMMSRGAACYIQKPQEPVMTFLSRMKWCHPTLLFCIPKFLEKVCTNRLIPYHFLKRIVFGKNIRMISSGGAILPPHIHSIIHNRMKIELLQGYGMTECSPMICLEQHSSNSIGELLSHMQIRIDDDGIAQVRGKGLFHGYLQSKNEIYRPDDKFTSDGWFSTGDVLRKDENHVYHYIKRQGIEFKLNNGKYVDPMYIESLLSEIFECVAAIPDKNHHSVIIIGRLKKDNPSKDMVLQKVRCVLLENKIENYAIPSGLILLNKPFSLEDGTLTIKMEVNRHIIRSIHLLG